MKDRRYVKLYRQEEAEAGRGCAAVRFVQVDEIKKQLHMDNVVLLSNLAFNVAGEVLNCNTYDVAVHAATELSADKIVFCVGEEVSRFRMRPVSPLSRPRSPSRLVSLKN